MIALPAVLSLLIVVLVIAFFVGGTCLVYMSRAMLAWSIDGVAPELVEKVGIKKYTILEKTVLP